MPAKNSSRFCASRAADVATKRIRSTATPAVADGLGVRIRGRERPLERVGVEGAGRVDALAEPDDLHPPVELAGPPSGPGSASSSRIEFVPQSMAATGPCTARGLPEGSDLGQRLIAQGIHPGTGGQCVPDQGVQALHPVRHPAGTDLGDLGDLVQLCRAAR